MLKTHAFLTSLPILILQSHIVVYILDDMPPFGLIVFTVIMFTFVVIMS